MLSTLVCRGLPMQVLGEAGLPPCGPLSATHNNPNGNTCVNLHELLLESIQIIKHSSMLDDDMRLFAFVVMAGVMPEYRSGIDTTINSQQRHADVLQVIVS